MRNKFLTGAALMRIFEKVKIFVLSLVLLCTIKGYAQWDTVYVDMSRPAGGDGQSWVSAFNELDTAISYNPDTNLVILCAEGTYYPKAVKGRFLRISNKDFKIIGGYPRLSTNNSKSNPDIFKVILDGDIDKNDSLMPDSTYIINGNNASTVLYLGGHGDCWLEGLTFQHGDNNSGNGGGLYVKGKTSILKCHFNRNRAMNGGAICVTSGKIIIRNNSSFIGNKAFQIGGAIFIDSTSNRSLHASDVLFEGNSATHCGAICSYMYPDSSFFDRCIFKDNKADSTYAVSYQSGGGYRNCVVNNNIAGHNFIISGSGYTNGPIIRECTIAYNEVAALYEQYILGYIASIHNSIVWNYYEKQIGYCPRINYSIIKDWTGGGVGNISEEPEFVGGGHHYFNLTGISPARDKGDPDTSGIAEYDILGNPRICKGRIDIGAYEHLGKIYVDSRAMGDNIGSSWGHAYNNLHVATQYSGDGDTIWVAKGVYKASDLYPFTNYTVRKNVALIGGFRGDETSLSQRDWRSNITTLTGEISPHYFTYNVIKLMDSGVVDGFRIINGEVSACYLDSSDNATIRNCIISNNSTSNYGAAITIANSDNVLIENCFISNNIADGPGVSGIGGFNSNNLNIRNCILTGNNNSITSNVSAALFEKCNLSIVNCTFSANNNRTLQFDTSSAVLINNIIWNDSTDSDTLIQLSNSSFNARNCDIRRGISGIKKDGSSIITDGGELFNLNPQFLDATSKYPNGEQRIC